MNTSSSMEEVESSNAGREAVRTGPSQPKDDPCDNGKDSVWCDDGSLCDDWNEEVDLASWDMELRRRQFHAIGYRDGLTAGKEASAQEGFNDGFKQSVLVGYKWGLVRGVTSALACLSDELKAKLAGTRETEEKLKTLYESVDSVSTKDALSFFHAEIMVKESGEECNHSEENFHVATMPNKIPSGSQLGKYIGEFDSLLESSTIRLHPTVEKHTVG